MEHGNVNPNDSSAPVAEASLDELVAQARAEGNPWAKMAGIFKDDPLYEEWLEAMRENRRKDDEELGI